MVACRFYQRNNMPIPGFGRVINQARGYAATALSEDGQRLFVAFPTWDTTQLVRIDTASSAQSEAVLTYPNGQEGGTPLLAAQ